MLENRKDCIGLIMEGLYSNKNRGLVGESFAKVIQKNFGKVTRLKEVWNSKESIDDTLQEIKTKYLSIATNSDDIDVDVLKEYIQKRPIMDLDNLPKIVFKLFKERYEIEDISNARIILKSLKKRKNRIELRYNRRALDIKQDIDIEDDIESFKVSDRSKILPEIDKVLEDMSNEVKPLKKEEVSVTRIQEESGCSLEVAKKASIIADNLFEESYKQEPKITKDIVDVVSKNHGTMYGLKFRLKQGTSLGRKIATDAFAPEEKLNGDLDKAARNVKDSIRYTTIFDRDDFTKGYNNVKNALLSKGYSEYRCKNFYIMYRDGKSQQKAVQCVFETREGLRFELQFHTPESMGAKEVNHPLYEKFRSVSTPEDEMQVLDKRMQNISFNVPDPVGVFTILGH